MLVRWARVILLLTGLCKTAVAADIPQDQRQFIDIVERFNRAYAKADNDMAKGATRPQRANAICAVFRTPVVRNWLGTVYKLSSNNDGKGVLELTLSTHVWVKTWNNSVSDAFDNTLIDPASRVFAQAVQLKKDQRVLFSGSFIPDRTDCFRESSVTLSGSMNEPEYLFRFTDIGAETVNFSPQVGANPVWGNTFQQVCGNAPCRLGGLPKQ